METRTKDHCVCKSLKPRKNTYVFFPIFFFILSHFSTISLINLNVFCAHATAAAISPYNRMQHVLDLLAYSKII